MVQDRWVHYGFRADPTYGSPLEEDAVVDRWTFGKSPPDVPVHPGVLAEIAFIDGKRIPRNVVQTLEHLVDCVESVLGRFAEYLATNPK